MPVIVVGTQRQFPGTRLPIDGVPEAQLQFVGDDKMTIPVCFHTGMKEEILLLVRIAQHRLMHDVCAEAACIEFQGSNRGSLINQEIAHLRNKETAGEQRLDEMVLTCLVAYAGQIAVVGAIMRPDTMIW